MPRRASRSLGSAGAARRLLPLSPLPLVAWPLRVHASRRPFHCTSLRCVPLQGGLVREAAVGRARAECRLRRVWIGSPILASLIGAREDFGMGVRQQFSTGCQEMSLDPIFSNKLARWLHGDAKDVGLLGGFVLLLFASSSAIAAIYGVNHHASSAVWGLAG